MRLLATKFVGSALTALTVSTGVMAQSYYDDQSCRQFADVQIAPLRDQASSQAIGSTILGAGLGAAFGAAVGGGRGAGIGAASGAIVGTGVGAANVQNKCRTGDRWAAGANADGNLYIAWIDPSTLPYLTTAVDCVLGHRRVGVVAPFQVEIDRHPFSTTDGDPINPRILLLHCVRSSDKRRKLIKF